MHRLNHKDATEILRSKALWYPRIPPANLCLNLRWQDFAYGDCGHGDYFPLLWQKFGGEKGRDLRRLTSIEASVEEDCLQQITFHYGQESDEASGEPSSVKFGCPQPIFLDFGKTVRFLIDGPGGEMISGIDLLSNMWPNRANKPVYSDEFEFYTIEVSVSLRHSSRYLANLVSRGIRCTRIRADRVYCPGRVRST